MFAHLLVALDEVAQAVEQLFGNAKHLLLILCLLVLHPRQMYHVKDAQQVLFASDEDLLFEGVAPQRRVVGQCQLQRALERHEHNDEVHGFAGSLDIFRIVLARQFCDVATHRLDVFLQGALLLFGRLGIDVALIGHQRHLRVNDRILSLWVVQNDVGLHLTSRVVVLQRAPLFVAQTGLYLVVNALRQSL